MADAVLVQRLIVSGAAIAALFITALLCVLVVAAGAGVARLVGRWRARRHQVGPDVLLLLEDLDAHLDDYVAADPELEAGFARLRAAIRDEQQKEAGDA